MPFVSDSSGIAALVEKLQAIHNEMKEKVSFIVWLNSLRGINPDADELLADLRSDRRLSENELAAKYMPIRGAEWGEHPLYKAADWRYEVENESTRKSYWNWILCELDMELSELSTA